MRSSDRGLDGLARADDFGIATTVLLASYIVHHSVIHHFFFFPFLPPFPELVVGPPLPLPAPPLLETAAADSLLATLLAAAVELVVVVVAAAVASLINGLACMIRAASRTSSSNRFRMMDDRHLSLRHCCSCAWRQQARTFNSSRHMDIRCPLLLTSLSSVTLRTRHPRLCDQRVQKRTCVAIYEQPKILTRHVSKGE